MSEYIRKEKTNVSKNLFENITDEEYLTLEWVLHNEGKFPADRFFDDPTVDGRIEELERNKLIALNQQTGLKITELGRAAIKEYYISKEHDQKLIAPLVSEINALNKIADTLNSQLKLLKEDSLSAASEVKFSKRIAIISIIVALIAIAVDIVGLFF